MNNLLRVVTEASLLAVVASPVLADEPRPVEATVAQSSNSGVLERTAPEMRAVIEKLIALGAKPVHTLTPGEARNQPTPADAASAVFHDRTGKLATPEAIAKTEDIKIQGVKGDLDARVYWPAGTVVGGKPLPLVVYFHGGGWVIATIDVYDSSARALANQSQAVVVSVEYRKGPENKFPAAHNDAVSAYSDILKSAQKWDADANRVAIVGESAGGGLAVAVAMAARDEHLMPPAAIIAVYPIAGKDTSTPSYVENQNAAPLGKADMEWFFKNYLSSNLDAADSRIDLVNANLSALPPITIIAAEIDPLRSDGELLRDKLKAAGNNVTYQEWNGVTHEFFGMAAVVPQAKAAQDLAGAQLRKAFEE